MLDNRMETASMRVFTDTTVWNRPIAEICWSHYLGGEGMSYAQRLVQAGVTTELHLYPGTFHGSAGLPGAAISQAMLAGVLDGLQRGLRVRSAA